MRKSQKQDKSITFEGQAAMEFEAAVEGKSLDYYKHYIVKGD
ncbi:MAG: hypothetical protein ABRQ25_02160 [Clostridiaceae bacterium]